MRILLAVKLQRLRKYALYLQVNCNNHAKMDNFCRRTANDMQDRFISFHAASVIEKLPKSKDEHRKGSVTQFFFVFLHAENKKQQ